MNLRMSGEIMETISIHPLQGEELLDVLYNFQMYAFCPSPPFQDKEGWAKVVRERKGVTYHALFEGVNAVAGAASTSMTQNVRGKLFPAGGVWGVVTLPAARRKGYSKQVLTSLLSAEKNAGKVFFKPVPLPRIILRAAGIRHPAIANHCQLVTCLVGVAVGQRFWRRSGIEIDW
jgi:hypothetical protein